MSTSLPRTKKDKSTPCRRPQSKCRNLTNIYIDRCVHQKVPIRMYIEILFSISLIHQFLNPKYDFGKILSIATIFTNLRVSSPATSWSSRGTSFRFLIRDVSSWTVFPSVDVLTCVSCWKMDWQDSSIKHRFNQIWTDRWDHDKWIYIW